MCHRHRRQDLNTFINFHFTQEYASTAQYDLVEYCFILFSFDSKQTSAINGEGVEWFFNRFFLFFHILWRNPQAYVKAISSGVENIQEVLLSPEAQKQLVSFGPRLVSHTTKARKTIDTEDTDLKCLAKPDGTLVTEKKQTTEHEELVDDQLPEEDDHSTGSRERIDHRVCASCEPVAIVFSSQ